jgi:hypothetical protein
MVAGMVFLARNNYLSRIGALWPTSINDRLSLSPAIGLTPLLNEYGFRTR